MTLLCSKCKTMQRSLNRKEGEPGLICDKCAGKKIKQKISKSAKQKFTRWICKRHDCGSYNFNALVRHEMDWCNIVYESSSTIKTPKTFGGMNGNVGRHYFRDWQEYCKDKERSSHVITAYSKWSAAKNRSLRRKRNAYRS